MQRRVRPGQELAGLCSKSIVRAVREKARDTAQGLLTKALNAK